MSPIVRAEEMAYQRNQPGSAEIEQVDHQQFRNAAKHHRIALAQPAQPAVGGELGGRHAGADHGADD